MTFLENDAVLGEMNDHFDGNYLGEESLLAAARKAGFATAAIGKVGPTAIQDVTERTAPAPSLSTTRRERRMDCRWHPMSRQPSRPQGWHRPRRRPAAPNDEQQKYMAAIATKAVLPMLVNSGKDVLMLFWSRDPDATQHNQNDSLGKLVPDIMGRPRARASRTRTTRWPR